ncbi:unnamed protein product [Tilletia controversa]|nr:unnamed protein product [Tilletia controversa]
MSDFYYRPGNAPPFSMGAAHSSPARIGVYLRGPDRRSRLIQLPATFMALVDKAANIFDIDRNTHDVIIVMADDEDCEIEEDSLPVLHDRERLLVKAVPRSPADRSMELYRPANAQAGPSHRLELPTFELPPAPSPAVLDLLPDHARDHTLPSPSGSQLSQVGSAASLQSVMKVKTCPNQSQARTAKEITTAHTSLNSALGVTASSARSSNSLPTPSSGISTSSPSSSSGTNVPTRRKRDVRRERKKHAERTIAREKALVEAEAAAAAARAHPSSSQSPRQSDGGTPSGSQSRRRIAFVGLPDESDENNGEGADASSSSSDSATAVKAEIMVSPSGNALKTIWDPDDSGEESQESPAKRRKLNADAVLASRKQKQQRPQQGGHTSSLQPHEQEQQQNDQDQDQDRRSAQEEEDMDVDAVAQVLSMRRQEKSRETPTELADPAFKPSQAALRSQESPERRQTRVSGKPMTYAEPVEIDSEEEEFTSISPVRSHPNTSPTVSLPRGRPPTNPVKRAQYERIKDEIKRIKLASPEKLSPRVLPSQERRRSSSPSKADSSAGSKSQTLHGRWGARSVPSSRDSEPPQASDTSKDVVRETPPGSPLQPVVEIVSPSTRRLSLDQLPTPPPSWQAPKKAPASRGGVGAKEPTPGSIRSAEAESMRAVAMDVDPNANDGIPSGLTDAIEQDTYVRRAKGDNAIRSSTNLMAAAAASAANRASLPAPVAIPAINIDASSTSTSATTVVHVELPATTRITAVSTPPLQKQPTSVPAFAQASTSPVTTSPPTSSAVQPSLVVTQPAAGVRQVRSPPLPTSSQPSATGEDALLRASALSRLESRSLVRQTSASPPVATPATSMDVAYQAASSIVEQLLKHPSNEFSQGKAMRDFSRFMHHCRDKDGLVNLLTIRAKVTRKLYHGETWAASHTENAPLVNFAHELNMNWENMRSFFGPESSHAKAVGELQKFSSRLLEEWTKTHKSQGSRGGSGATAASSGSGSGNAGAAGGGATGALAANGSSSRSNAEGNGRNGRSGTSSGRSTPVLDAKAIQNAARNGGQMPSALGLSVSTPSGQQNGGGPGSDSSGSQAWQSWITKNMPGKAFLNKALGSSGSGSSGGSAGEQMPSAAGPSALTVRSNLDPTTESSNSA